MFQDKLRELRESKGVSQYELASIVHVSRGAISKWERGQGIPSECNLISLCNYFNVSEEYLLSRDDFKRELKKKNDILKKTLEHLPIYIISIIVILLSVVELFVYVREGIYAASGDYYDPFSILTIFKGYIIIPLSIYFICFTLNILYCLNIIELDKKNHILFYCSTLLTIILTFTVSFIIAYVSKPFNYGMFWRPH